MLSCHDIKKSYGDLTVLNGVDLSLKAGEITVLIGPSGSGKSTLLKILSMLTPPDSGTINFEEHSYSFPLKNGGIIAPPWPKVTVVFQQLFLWPHLSLRENILLPLESRSKKSDDKYLDSLISLFEMEQFIDRYPNEASLGQKQRAALVRALVLEPEFILLDEITSSLDVEQIALILGELKTMAKKGIGILVITHLLQFAKEAADQIVFMDGGKVLEAGDSSVLTDPQNERVKKFLSVIESAT